MLKTIVKKTAAKLGYDVVRTENKEPAASPDLAEGVCRKAGVPMLEAPSLEAYRRSCPPLFPEPVPVPSDVTLKHHGSLREALSNISMAQYFNVNESNGAWSVTDDYEGSHYYSRQRMLYGIYTSMLDDGLRGSSVLDIGCSSGYYSFFCSRLGAGRVLGIDARPEHQEQFQLLHRMLNLPDSCQYRNVDMEFELEQLGETVDVVLAQGVMYHVYDHPRFIRNLYQLTNKLLVLEGGCSGRSDLLCKADMEDVDNLRASIHGPVLYPSLPWMIALMRWAGFREVQYVRLPPGIPDEWGFGGLWRAMLVALK